MVRHTIQRDLVLRAVRELRCHATADEIYCLISKTHSDISKATVYRNLNNLSQEGYIRKRSLPGEPDRYDHDCSKHYHIRCEKCQNLFDVDMDYIDNLEANIHNKHGFVITSHDIFFSGICPECRKTTDK